MSLSSDEDDTKRRRLSDNSGEVPSDPTTGSQLGHLALAAQGSTGSEPQGQQAALAALSNPAGIGNNATDLLAGLHGNPYQGQGLPGYGVANLMAARQAAPQGFGQVNPQLLQLQQQLGYAAPQVSPMHANSAQLMAALGLPNPSAPMSGFGLESLLGRMQQPSASAINEGYIQQLMAAGGGGLLNHGMNPAAALGGLQGLGGAASGRDQLLSLLASAVTGSNGLSAAAGGNQTAAALLLAQLNGGGGTASARSSDPPGSTSGLASIKRARDDVDAEKTRAIAALENKPLIPNPGLMGRDPIQLYMSCDDERLSAYHALARKHIDFFEANKDDISTNARGRNRPIVLGQVGIRCRHCSHLPPRRRQRAAMYYPFKLDLLYQACQTLANVHLCEQCQHFPADVRAELVKLRGEKTTALVGKKYWADGARIHDVYEAHDGLRFRPIKKEGGEEKDEAKAESKEGEQEESKASAYTVPAARVELAAEKLGEKVEPAAEKVGAAPAKVDATVVTVRGAHP